MSCLRRLHQRRAARGVPDVACVGWTLSFYDQLTIQLALPIVASACLLLLATVTWLVRGCRMGWRLRDLFMSPISWTLHIWAILILYPSISSETVATFDCVRMRDVRLLRADPCLFRRCFYVQVACVLALHED